MNESIKNRRPGRPRIDAAQHAAMRDRIADVAGRLFRSEGYGSISMRRVAKELSINPMTLYRYYPTKLAMLSRIWNAIFEDVFNRIDVESRTVANPRQRLTILSSLYVSYWLEHRENYHLVFMSSGLSRTDVETFVAEEAAASKFQVFFQCLAEIWETGETDGATKQRADQLICGLHGIMHCIITMPGYPWTNTATLADGMVLAALHDKASDTRL